MNLRAGIQFSEKDKFVWFVLRAKVLELKTLKLLETSYYREGIKYTIHWDGYACLVYIEGVSTGVKDSWSRWSRVIIRLVFKVVSCSMKIFRSLLSGQRIEDPLPLCFNKQDYANKNYVADYGINVTVKWEFVRRPKVPSTVSFSSLAIMVEVRDKRLRPSSLQRSCHWRFGNLVMYYSTYNQADSIQKELYASSHCMLKVSFPPDVLNYCRYML